jgi:adenylate kinase family enzyme
LPAAVLTERARLVTFHRQTEPLIAYYHQAGLLQEVNGEGDIVRVTEDSLASIRELVKRSDRAVSHV